MGTKGEGDFYQIDLICVDKFHQYDYSKPYSGNLPGSKEHL